MGLEHVFGGEVEAKRDWRAIDRRTRRQGLRLAAEDAAIVRPRRGRLGLGLQFLRLAGRKLRLRLCDVCAGHFAHIEAVTRLLERLFELPHLGRRR